MLIQNRPIDDLKPYENNPRQNDDAVAVVAESIRQFGFRRPIVVDAEGVIGGLSEAPPPPNGCQSSSSDASHSRPVLPAPLPASP